MSTSSGGNLSPGCRDRLMIASSVACIVALFVSILGLVRSLFDITWPYGESGAGRLCLQFGHAESDLPSSMWTRSVQGLTSRSPRAAVTVVPTITHTPPAPAPTPSSAVSRTMEITTQVNYSATTGHRFQAPILLKPESEAQLQGEVHFQWQWQGQKLPEGLAFDLLIWSEAEHQDHQGRGALGVVETDPSLQRDVDLDYVRAILEHGGGIYFWTVIVVQKEPYRRVGTWGEKRAFTYEVPEPPTEPWTESP
jgi:hypothetical protein